MQLLMTYTLLICIFAMSLCQQNGFRMVCANACWSVAHVQKIHDLYHCMNMDDFFNSMKFTIAVAMCKKKVLKQGLLWKNGQGIPLCIVQEEVIGKKAGATVMAADLEWDPRAQGIILHHALTRNPSI